MTKIKEKWYREPSPKTYTNISIPPLKKNFFEDTHDYNSTPIGDEGSQNSIDNCRNSKTRIKISYEKIPYSFFQDNLLIDEFEKYLEASEFVDPNDRSIFKNNKKDIPVLIFEDFNTTGVTGNPFRIQEQIDGERNDFFAFWWQLYGGGKKEGKGGSVGVGRLTFAYSSQIQTFFSFSVPHNNAGKKFFLGVSVFGKYTESDNSYDSFCRFGVGDKGKFYPITDEQRLREYHKGFKLKRDFDEPGLSMIVPFPDKEHCEIESLKINLLERYRYSIYKDEIEIDILGETLSKKTLDTFIKKHKSKEVSKYAKYFEFIENCSQMKNDKFNIIQDEDNSREIRDNHLSKENIDKFTKEFSAGNIVPCKLNFEIIKADHTVIDGKIKIFLQKTENGMGSDDIMRLKMPVSGERKFGDKDVFALTLIEDPDTAEFARLSESENHKRFDYQTLKEKNLYTKFSNPLKLLTRAAPSLHSLLLESESQKTSVDATKDFFSFGSQDPDSSGTKNKDGTGVDTKFKIPEYLFNDPKIYEIKKIKENNYTGFEIYGANVMKETIKNIEQIERIIKDDHNEKEDEDSKKKIEQKDLNRLNRQLRKLKERRDKNCEDLFPSDLHITIWEDMQKYKKTSKKFYDCKNDFNLSEDIGKSFEVSSEGVLNKTEKYNKITFRVKNQNFKYKMLTSRFKSKEGQPTDIGVSPYALRVEK